MAQYEELVELGFEGVDKFADKYHDRVYDRLPGGRGRGKGEERRGDQQQQGHAPSQEYYPSQPLSGEKSGAARNMSRYDHARRGSEDYYGEEGGYHDDGFQVQSRDGVGGTRGQDGGSQYDTATVSARTRPALQNQRRGSSWSPPRKAHLDSYDHSRSSHASYQTSTRQRPRAHSRDGSKDKQRRLAAMLGGALIGGLVGTKASKGGKFDAAGTFVGAVVGGLGAREVAEWSERRAEGGGRRGRKDGDGEEGGRREKRNERCERESRDERR